MRQTSNTDLVRVELPRGAWVEVKRALGRDDERWVQKRVLSAARVDPVTGAQVFDAGELYDVATFATFEVAIKRWSFRVPVSPSNLRALEDDEVEALTAALNEQYPKPLEDEEKNA